MKQAVAAILFNPERTEVLLIQRRDIPVWVLPGGGIDQGETPEKACVREMFEETGYRVAIKRKVADYLPVNRLTQPTHFFECSLVGGTPTCSEETKAVAFFSLKKLPKYLAPPYRSWIADAEQNLQQPLVKKIEGVSYWILLRHLFAHPILVGRFLLTKIGIHINK